MGGNQSLSKVSENETRRLVYFRGHRQQQQQGAMICRLCKNWQTLPVEKPQLSWLEPGIECATRTLLHLYNLQTVRGICKEGILLADTAMSGPHDYYGFIEPTEWHRIEILGGEPTIYQCPPPLYETTVLVIIRPEPSEIVLLKGHWLQGRDLTKEQIHQYGLEFAGEEKELALDEGTNEISPDSLFSFPGVFEGHDLSLQLIADPQTRDLSTFGASVVPNDRPFAFDQETVAKNPHAQHRLRLITYRYASHYAEEYLAQGNGLFVERHEFIQCITPLDEKCGGFVLLGRSVEEGVELIAITIPFGYTLLIEPWAIHGDATLVGRFLMAMTGNHKAMATADTVYLKRGSSKDNLLVTVNGLPPVKEQDYSPLISDKISPRQLRNLDAELRAGIPPVKRLVDRLSPVNLYAPESWSKVLSSLP
jgi:hypothetical protein